MAAKSVNAAEARRLQDREVLLGRAVKVLERVEEALDLAVENPKVEKAQLELHRASGLVTGFLHSASGLVSRDAEFEKEEQGSEERMPRENDRATEFAGNA